MPIPESVSKKRTRAQAWEADKAAKGAASTKDRAVKTAEAVKRADAYAAGYVAERKKVRCSALGCG